MIHALLLAGLYVISSPATPGEGVRHVAHTKSHRRHSQLSRDLQAHYINKIGDKKIRTAGIKLSWNGQGGRLEQTLIFPQSDPKETGDDIGGWFLSRQPRSRMSPHAFLWLSKARSSIVFVADEFCGTDVIQTPLIYTLHGDQWKLLPNILAFTSRGTFFIQRNNIYMCDYDTSENFAHFAPHRYLLMSYVVKNDKLVLLRTRRTYHRYPRSPGYPLTPDEEVPLNHAGKIDPLREFGMRWRLWGEGREGIKISGDPN